MTWPEAVVQMGKWYEANIHVYENWNTVSCPLLGGGQIRRDCSGFTSACLRLFGINGFNTNSGGFASSSSVASSLTAAGFIKMPFNTSILQPFDIYTHAQQPGAKFGHVEICASAGKTWGWGSCHDGINGHQGMPSSWVAPSAKHPYSTIWRHSSLNNMSAADIAAITPQYSAGDFAGMGGDYFDPGCCGQQVLSIDGLTGEALKEKCPSNIEYSKLWGRCQLKAIGKTPTMDSFLKKEYVGGFPGGGGGLPGGIDPSQFPGGNAPLTKDGVNLLVVRGTRFTHGGRPAAYGKLYVDGQYWFDTAERSMLTPGTYRVGFRPDTGATMTGRADWLAKGKAGDPMRRFAVYSNGYVPLVLGTTGRSGIRIHQGTSVAWSEGCLVTGIYNGHGLDQSWECWKKLYDYCVQAKEVTITYQG